MPLITNINFQTKNKKRCNLFVDGEFFSGVSLETVMLNRLKVGQEINKEQLKKLLEENERREALSKAADYVSKCLKTKRQVKDYLIRKGYSEEIAWYCVDKLKEYDYVNDEEYSKRFIESAAVTQGKRLTEYKLMMKGVKKEDIEKAFFKTEVDMLKKAEATAEKYLRNKEKTKEILAKAYRYLIGRGFSYSEASEALARYDKQGD